MNPSATLPPTARAFAQVDLAARRLYSVACNERVVVGGLVPWTLLHEREREQWRRIALAAIDEYRAAGKAGT